ncbi:HNH endonuclease [Kitasatospora purpeofusca]|uniref:HNH endonuclease n=1 Tax=Kitasatospora purpeofusca TaxID=67352 RepID=UPI00380C0662
MIERDPQRFFSPSQRQVLYELAEGGCQRCSTELEEGWHADHKVPWSVGGPTSIENGQALCDACNAKKGTDMQFSDDFVPRPFQREVLFRVVERIRDRQQHTVVLASPGSGKTLTYQALATDLIRLGLIDYVAVFVPRTSLAEQCETGWMWQDRGGEIRGLCHLFDQRKRLGRVRHKVSEAPLTKASEQGSGFVSTYQALATNERLFLNWAKINEDRFLLVADEAQFCGAEGDKTSGGTRAGELIEKLSRYARHTLLLTGTPYRADNQPLILADYEPDPENPKQRKLVFHAEAKYSDGIAEGYLRTFELQLTEANVARRILGDPETGKADTLVEYKLSTNGEELMPVLRDEKVWKPLTNRVVRQVRDKQKFNPHYRGLISCMQKAEATKVYEYLRREYPELRVALAVSGDQDAPQELAEFKSKPMDILVTVRMAFIGYDCPQITVVGILTHFRHRGHLMQLVGRGLRVWKDMPAREQSCVIVAPDDPKMTDFLAFLREEEQEGLRVVDEREKKEAAEPGQAPLSYIESAEALGTRAASNEVDMDEDEVFLVENIKRAVGSAETVTTLKEVIELAGLMLKDRLTVPTPRTETSTSADAAPTPKTERDSVAEINAQTSDTIKSRLYQIHGKAPDAPGYQDLLKNATVKVNRAAGYTASEANTIEKAMKRLRAALELK